MGLLSLAIKNITGNTFRSLAIFLCSAVLAGLAMAATFVVRGAEIGLRDNLQRLGADILVLPWGTMTEKIGGVRLMSAAIDGWMPRSMLNKIAEVEGVEQVSAQQFLTTLFDSQYSPYPKMYLVAYDPATDFALSPWMTARVNESLAAGQAVAGAHVALPEGGSSLALYGTEVRIVDRLEQTNTTIDNSLFISFSTADAMIAWSQANEMEPLDIMPGSISAVMVKVKLDSDPHTVAVRILDQVKGAVPLETPNIYQSERRQMIGVLRAFLGALGGIWALMVIFMGLVFTIAVNERRFEIGVLRALGFPGTQILKILLLEGAALAVTGGLTGVIAVTLGFSAFSDQFATLTRLPLHIPSTLGLLSISVGGQVLALISVTLAAFFPAWRISHEEVAVTMRD